MPFGEGQRLCTGRQMAYNQISYILCKFFQSFDSLSLSGADGEEISCGGRIEKISPRMHISMYSEGGLWTRFRVL